MVGHRIAYGLWLLGWLLVWALSKSAMPGCILAGSLGAAALEIALTALADKYLRVSLCAQLSAQKGETDVGIGPHRLHFVLGNCCCHCEGLAYGLVGACEILRHGHSAEHFSGVAVDD